MSFGKGLNLLSANSWHLEESKTCHLGKRQRSKFHFKTSLM